MATTTQPARKPSRRALPGWARAAASAVVVMVALAVAWVGVVAPLSAGLPIGWGQQASARYHLHIGTPPLWNVVADSQLYRSALVSCGYAVVASPLSEAAPHATLDAMLLPRWMAVFVAAPCDQSAPTTTTTQTPWQATGQRVTIAGQRVAIQTLAWPSAQRIPNVTDSASVTLHGYTYTFQLQEPTAALAKQDMPDFLTFAGSFRYTP
jgi:hypothetical protein